jgi:preprotein translocase subunit SecG
MAVSEGALVFAARTGPAEVGASVVEALATVELGGGVMASGTLLATAGGRGWSGTLAARLAFLLFCFFCRLFFLTMASWSTSSSDDDESSEPQSAASF